MPRSTPGKPPRNDRPSWYDEQAGPLVRLYALTRGRAEGPADEPSPAPDAAGEERNARGEDAR